MRFIFSLLWDLIKAGVTAYILWHLLLWIIDPNSNVPDSFKEPTEVLIHEDPYEKLYNEDNLDTRSFVEICKDSMDEVEEAFNSGRN